MKKMALVMIIYLVFALFITSKKLSAANKPLIKLSDIEIIVKAARDAKGKIDKVDKNTVKQLEKSLELKKLYEGACGGKVLDTGCKKIYDTFLDSYDKMFGILDNKMQTLQGSIGSNLKRVKKIMAPLYTNYSMRDIYKRIIKGLRKSPSGFKASKVKSRKKSKLIYRLKRKMTHFFPKNIKLSASPLVFAIQQYAELKEANEAVEFLLFQISSMRQKIAIAKIVGPEVDNPKVQEALKELNDFASSVIGDTTEDVEADDGKTSKSDFDLDAL